MQNFNKQHPRPKINIPKTPQQLFLKKGDEVKQEQSQVIKEVIQPVKKVKHMDDLYSKTFLDHYFEL